MNLLVEIVLAIIVGYCTAVLWAKEQKYVYFLQFFKKVMLARFLWFTAYVSEGNLKGLMPKTSISWKYVWIYLKSQIQFKKMKFNLNLKKVCPVLKSISNMDLVESNAAMMCTYSTIPHNKLEYTHRVHVWNEFSDRIKRFQI